MDAGRTPAGRRPDAGQTPAGRRPDTGRTLAGCHPAAGQTPDELYSRYFLIAIRCEKKLKSKKSGRNFFNVIKWRLQSKTMTMKLLKKLWTLQKIAVKKLQNKLKIRKAINANYVGNLLAENIFSKDTFYVSMKD